METKDLNTLTSLSLSSLSSLSSEKETARVIGKVKGMENEIESIRNKLIAVDKLKAQEILLSISMQLSSSVCTVEVMHRTYKNV